jgi:hypothetical protein
MGEEIFFPVKKITGDNRVFTDRSIQEKAVHPLKSLKHVGHQAARVFYGYAVQGF